MDWMCPRSHAFQSLCFFDRIMADVSMRSRRLISSSAPANFITDPPEFTFIVRGSVGWSRRVLTHAVLPHMSAAAQLIGPPWESVKRITLALQAMISSVHSDSILLSVVTSTQLAFEACSITVESGVLLFLRSRVSY